MPLAYVVILSEHNFCELVTCLHFRPARVIALASEFVYRSRAVERFVAALNQALPELTVEILPTTEGPALQGATFQECQHWMNAVVMPRLTELHSQGYELMLNTTGGTKPMAVVLLHLLSWSEVHYVPVSRSAVQVERFRFTATGRVETLPTCTIAQTQVTPSLHAMLYNDSVNEHSPNSISLLPNSVAVAKQLFAANCTEFGNSGWWWLSAQLEQWWFRPQKSTHAQLVYADAGPYAAEVSSLLKALSSLCPHYVQWHNEHTQLPTSKHKKSEAWRKWVAGFWFEQWVEDCLLRLGVSRQDLQLNLQLSDHIDASGRETDILLRVGGRLCLLELKLDLPAGESPTNIIHRILSLDRLGKVTRVLVLGPGFRQRFTSDEAWAAFETKCRASHIGVLVVNAEQDLAQLLVPT